MTIVRRIARPMLAGTFLVGGYDALRDPGSKVPAAKPWLDRIGPMLRLPDDPELLVRVNGLIQVTGGVMLAIGKLPRVGGALLVGSLVPTTLAGHAFWEKTDPQERKFHRTQFLKNLGLIGGALLAVVDTGGKPGLIWRVQDAGHRTQREAKHALKTAQREATIAKRGARIKVQDAIH